MHDPMVVAFEIRRPWPRVKKQSYTTDRWKFRLYHNCGIWCEDQEPHEPGPFPWWKPSSWSSSWLIAGRDCHFPEMITIWHVEPDDQDALTVCSRRIRENGKWRYTKGWKWHVHHWHIQVGPLQMLRRYLLTRCSGCGGKSRRGNPVNVAHGWYQRKTRFWQGEKELYHSGCDANLMVPPK